MAGGCDGFGKGLRYSRKGESGHRYTYFVRNAHLSRAAEFPHAKVRKRTTWLLPGQKKMQAASDRKAFSETIFDLLPYRTELFECWLSQTGSALFQEMLPGKKPFSPIIWRTTQFRSLLEYLSAADLAKWIKCSSCLDERVWIKYQGPEWSSLRSSDTIVNSWLARLLTAVLWFVQRKFENIAKNVLKIHTSGERDPGPGCKT